MSTAHRLRHPFDMRLGENRPHSHDDEWTMSRTVVLISFVVALLLLAGLVVLSSLGVMPAAGGGEIDYWMMP